MNTPSPVAYCSAFFAFSTLYSPLVSFVQFTTSQFCELIRNVSFFPCT
uniref:Uncharacterized protein n=1 Tax=Arundo donax TaxID=35708 RepID=A0A0A9GPG2_ARUDO